MKKLLKQQKIWYLPRKKILQQRERIHQVKMAMMSCSDIEAYPTQNLLDIYKLALKRPSTLDPSRQSSFYEMWCAAFEKNITQFNI